MQGQHQYSLQRCCKSATKILRCLFESWSILGIVTKVNFVRINSNYNIFIMTWNKSMGREATNSQYSISQPHKTSPTLSLHPMIRCTTTSIHIASRTQHLDTTSIEKRYRHKQKPNLFVRDLNRQQHEKTKMIPIFSTINSLQKEAKYYMNPIPNYKSYHLIQWPNPMTNPLVSRPLSVLPFHRVNVHKMSAITQSTDKQIIDRNRSSTEKGDQTHSQCSHSSNAISFGNITSHKNMGFKGEWTTNCWSRTEEKQTTAPWTDAFEAILQRNRVCAQRARGGNGWSRGNRSKPIKWKWNGMRPNTIFRGKHQFHCILPSKGTKRTIPDIITNKFRFIFHSLFAALWPHTNSQKMSITNSSRP